MKVWISVDMEGISGLVDRDQFLPDGHRYETARKAMMKDLTSVLEALEEESDVSAIWVNDSHDGMLNLPAETMPNTVHLITGGSKQWSMNQGVDCADVAFYIGYHARAGTPAAIMDHTYAGEIASVTLNGQEVGETGINAALAGHWNVPVALISGDSQVAQEAQSLLPGIETVVVKYPFSRRSAELLAPLEVDRRLKDGVHRALEKFRQGVVGPWRLAEPIHLTVSLMTPEMADRAMYCPGAQRLDGRKVGFEEPNMEEAFRAFYTVMALNSGRPLY
ncbi:MAG: M55 family metallopeptidase [Firmicutes bacterium]|jgi:D-amino peptidase|uniref:Peptidase M55 n=1 Tax=Sulfobacillus benefaciens TaxID=453960 RepID=A0A2T2XBT9_9FIRM|nr:M55 family metallopeptidase [Bacillota bacterium]MCL5014750.1 M55 family metallopeptidase [Bacillota bacterium]PSR31928.1 MAG: peptidase M55 [Sulfobacillus benefaciens]